MICRCPQAAALPDVAAVTCPESFGQIQKFAIQRLSDGAGNLNGFDSAGEPPADITTNEAWTTAIAAVDSKKIVISPYVNAPTWDGGAPRTFGGGNETLGGIPKIIGREPMSFNGVFRSVPQDIIAALKQIQCENVGVYLFDENGSIACLKDEETETKFLPIPIRAFFVGDKVFGGFEADDSNAVQWMFLPNYSDKLVRVEPKFNPLDLAPAK